MGGIWGQHRPQGCRGRDETHVIQTLAVPIHANLNSGLRHLEGAERQDEKRVKRQGNQTSTIKKSGGREDKK